MEIVGEIIGQFIGEILLGFTKTIIYKVFIRPILITLGFMNISIKNLFIKDIKSSESITYDALEKAGGDLIIGIIVVAILLLIAFMIVYLGFYICAN